MFSAVPPPQVVLEGVTKVEKIQDPPPRSLEGVTLVEGTQNNRSEKLKYNIQRLALLKQKHDNLSKKMATKRKRAFNRKKQTILQEVLGKLTTEEKIEGGIIKDQEVINDYHLKQLKKEKEQQFKLLLPYYQINQKFLPISHGRYEDKSPLEEALEQAIKDGKIELADKISNRITVEENIKKIDAAIERKQLEDQGEIQTTKKKSPSLHWGFESKHRWESKGNM